MLINSLPSAFSGDSLTKQDYNNTFGEWSTNASSSGFSFRIPYMDWLLWMLKMIDGQKLGVSRNLLIGYTHSVWPMFKNVHLLFQYFWGTGVWSFYACIPYIS